MSKFCNKCGASLLPGAKFCGECGIIVESECGNVKVDEATEADNIPVEKLPARFETLMKAIWMAIGLNALSLVISLFDVRQYYSLGRFGVFLLCGGGVALSIWLALAIVQRKNWARVTFIIGVLAGCMLQYKFFSGDGNGYCIFLDCIALAIDLFCVVLLLTNKISRCFIKVNDGVKRAVIFWGVLVAQLVLSCGYGLYYEFSNEDEFISNCAEAAARGSKEAYQTLINYAEQNKEISRSDIDAVVESKRKNDGTHTNYRGQGAPALYWGSKMLMKVKAVGKAVAVIGVLLCGIGAWFKKKFVNGDESK